MWQPKCSIAVRLKLNLQSKMPPTSLFRSLVLYFAANMQHSVQDRPFETLSFTEVILNMYFEISTNYPEST